MSADCHTPPTPPSEGAPPPDAPRPPEVSSLRLVGTLAFFGAIAGFLIVLVFQWTRPRIDAHKALVLRQAALEVLGEPQQMKSIFVYQGRLVDALPAGVDSPGLDRLYLGLDAGGRPVGYAIEARGTGFQDVIDLIFGYDAHTKKLLGMKVLESKETPGLGEKIESDSSFVAGFRGPTGPIVGVKKGQEKGDPHEVDMITGATISSRAVIGIIDARLAEVTPLLDAYTPGGRR